MNRQLKKIVKYYVWVRGSHGHNQDWCCGGGLGDELVLAKPDCYCIPRTAVPILEIKSKQTVAMAVIDMYV